MTATKSTYLHGGEIADAVKFKNDLHKTIGEALIGPADVVISRPYVVHMTMCKII